MRLAEHFITFSQQVFSFINPFMPNGISLSYQLDQSISVLKSCWEVLFIFIQILIRAFCKQTVETLIRHRILWCLIWVCTVCLCPTKRMLGLYGLTPMKQFLTMDEAQLMKDCAQMTSNDHNSLLRAYDSGELIIIDPSYRCHCLYNVGYYHTDR